MKLKWAYSTIKGHFIGFKITVVLDEKTLCLVSILIHPGAPHDSNIFDEIMKEIKRRRIIKTKNILLFDKGYYSYETIILRLTNIKLFVSYFQKAHSILKN